MSQVLLYNDVPLTRVLFDSDVLLDVLANRQPFVAASAQALDTITRSQAKSYVAGHAVTNIFYILRKQIDSQSAREILSRLMQRIQVADITNHVIQAAFQSSISDFEDAVISEAACSVEAQLILTRNTKDFTESPILAVSPEDFLIKVNQCIEQLKLFNY